MSAPEAQHKSSLNDPVTIIFRATPSGTSLRKYAHYDMFFNHALLLDASMPMHACDTLIINEFAFISFR